MLKRWSNEIHTRKRRVKRSFRQESKNHTFDDTTITGILTRAEYRPDRYQVANYSFRKTHVKKIEVIK